MVFGFRLKVSLERKQDFMAIKILCAVGDWPPTLNWSKIFSLISQFSFDGVELRWGLKYLWEGTAKLNRLSKNYKLPITSLHTPTLLKNWWIQEKTANYFFKTAKSLGCQILVFHPPAKISLKSKKAKRLFNKLLLLQKQYELTFGLENMSSRAFFWDKLLGKYHSSTHQLSPFQKAIKGANLPVIFDTSHAAAAGYNILKFYQAIKGNIVNIHLSNFDQGKEHQPLYKGQLPLERLLKRIKMMGIKDLLPLKFLTYLTIKTKKKLKKNSNQISNL